MSVHFCSLAIIQLTILLPSSTTGQCPNKCQCTYNENGQLLINCRYAGLFVVPIFSQTNLAIGELTLYGNNISAIRNNSFLANDGSALAIVNLDLRSNPITSVEINAFSGLGPNLQQILMDVQGMTSFPDAALSELTHLQVLNLTGFNIASLPPNALQTLININQLQLSNCGLNALNPEDFIYQINSTQILDLSQNQLQSVPTVTLTTLLHLRSLDLSENVITSIGSNAFQGLTNLIYLDSAGNILAQVESDAFSDLDNSLTSLDLNHCRLTSFNLNPLIALVNLKNLNLGYNVIEDLPTGLFDGMANLRSLDLQFNLLRSLKATAFSGLKQLKKLDLSGNNITTIEATIFQNNNMLLQLDLSNNNLWITLVKNSFQGIEDSLRQLNLRNVRFGANNWASIAALRALQTLTLTENNISYIPDLAFSDMTNLSVLYLDSNNLTELTQTQLYGLQNSLTTIYLDANNIATIENCTFEGFTQLRTISLLLNPLQCDCQLQWLRSFIVGGEDLINWRCASPELYQQRSFSNLTLQQLSCAQNYTWPQCNQYTTALTTQSSGKIVVSNEQLQMYVYFSTSTTITVKWTLVNEQQFQSITGFRVEVSDKEGIQTLLEYSSNIRQADIGSVLDSRIYRVCLTVTYKALDSANTTASSDLCTNVTTSSSSSSTSALSTTTSIIVGCVIGGVCFIVVILIAALFFVKFRNRKNHKSSLAKVGGQSNLHNENTTDTTVAQNSMDLPHIGMSSKRFSKPRRKGANNNSMTTENLEKSLRDLAMTERAREGAAECSRTNVTPTPSSRYVSEPSTVTLSRYSPEASGAGYSNENELRLNVYSIYDEIKDEDVYTEQNENEMNTKKQLQTDTFI